MGGVAVSEGTGTPIENCFQTTYLPFPYGVVVGTGSVWPGYGPSVVVLVGC